MGICDRRTDGRTGKSNVPLDPDGGRHYNKYVFKKVSLGSKNSK